MLRISADGAKGNKFLKARPSPLLHQLNAHHEVIVRKRPGIGLVSP
jgi:hypothetical protein